MTSAEWHPLIEPLVQGLDQQTGKIVLPEGALASVAGRAPGLDAAGRHDVAVQLVALATMAWRNRGSLDAEDLVQDLARVAAALLGDAAQAADMFNAAGLKSAAATIGATAEVRAPRAEPKPAAANVKVARGLRKP